jgi:hypothetical protein
MRTRPDPDPQHWKKSCFLSMLFICLPFYTLGRSNSKQKSFSPIIVFFYLKYFEFFVSNFPYRIVLFAAARVEHAHGGAGDDVRDLQQEGEEQVVPAPTSRHASRRSAQKIIKIPVPPPLKGHGDDIFYL